MKLICAVVKPFKVIELVDAFRNEKGFPGMTVLQGEGFGRRPVPLRSPIEDLRDFTPHSMILVAAPMAQVNAITDLIARIAHTGQPGDGKLFVLPLEAAIALTRGERGEAALS